MAVPELTTTSAVATYLGDSSLSSSLTTYLAAAENWIARTCNRWDLGQNHWLTASRTEYIDGNQSPFVMLRWTPISAVSSVDIVTGASTSYSLTLTDLEVDGIAIASLGASSPTLIGRLGLRNTTLAGPSAWDVTPARSDSNRYQDWPNFGGGRNRVKVVYTGGYATVTPIPDLTMAAMELTAAMWRNKDVNPNLKSETLGDYAYVNGDGSATRLGSLSEALRNHIRPVF